jgi:hypothetical protein
MAVHVHVSDDAVDITFSGIDKWTTLSPSGQHLAMADVTGARVLPRTEARAARGWRVGGGHWVDWLATGWFTEKDRKGVRELWCVYRDEEVLVIDTVLDKPCRVVLQHPDRHDLAWYIGERLARHSP